MSASFMLASIALSVCFALRSITDNMADLGVLSEVRLLTFLGGELECFPRFSIWLLY